MYLHRFESVARSVVVNLSIRSLIEKLYLSSYEISSDKRPNSWMRLRSIIFSNSLGSLYGKLFEGGEGKYQIDPDSRLPILDRQDTGFAGKFFYNHCLIFQRYQSAGHGRHVQHRRNLHRV